jgi:hypothetical protein
MSPMTAAERKRAERERMRLEGFVLRQVWVHPDDWPRVSRYVTLVRRNREAALLRRAARRP